MIEPATWHLQDYAALLFDCDGTLADTMPAHYRAWRHVTELHGLAFDEDRFYSLGGRPTREILVTLATEASVEIDLDHATDLKEQMFIEQLPHVEAIDPVIAAVHRARSGADCGRHRWLPCGSPADSRTDWPAGML